MLYLDGVLWHSSGNPDLLKGNPARPCDKLKDAVSLAQETLSVYRYPKRSADPLEVLRPMLGNATSGISWNGFNVVGSQESIAEVRRLIEFESARKIP